MGCGGSKATTVAIDPANSQQSDGGAATAEMGGSSPVAKSPTTERVPTPAGPGKQIRRPSRVAPLGASTEDLQAEELPEGDIKEQRVTEQSLAFVIPFEDEPSEESIIKKHPPKRLQRLEENAGPLPTLEEITEKQAVVEMRRQQILQSRVLSSKNMRNGKSIDAENPDEDGLLDVDCNEIDENTEINGETQDENKSENKENIKNNNLLVPENDNEFEKNDARPPIEDSNKNSEQLESLQSARETAVETEKEGVDY